jgi:hypothetical protein
MTKTVVLHIGQSKTGTTAIQRLFWLNRTAFAGLGVHYLQTGVTTSDSPAHYGLLSENFKMPPPAPSCGLSNDYTKAYSIWKVAREEIEKSRGPLFLISCESGWLLDSEAVRYVRAVLEGYRVFIVLVLREPRSYIVSSYKQAIKVGRSVGTFEDFLAIRRCWLDYPRLMERWASMFGRESLGVFAYAEMKEDLLRNFAASLGLDIAHLTVRDINAGLQHQANVTPADSVLWAIRLLHRFESRLPGLPARVVKRFRKRLADDVNWWVTSLVEMFPKQLVSPEAEITLDELPDNSNVAFDSRSDFGVQVRLALSSCPKAKQLGVPDRDS